MEIRAIRHEEHVAARKVQSIAFDFGTDFSHDTASGDYRTCRAFFDGGSISACLDYLPFRALLNGRQVGMAGIGGVASLPEERGKGHIRALLRHTLEEARENGDTLSYLYPFSHVYYRKFGYESCMVKNNTSIPLSAFKGLVGGKSMRMYLPTDDSDSIQEVYKRFAADKNFMLIRGKEAWKKLLEIDPYKNKRHVYIWYSAENCAEGYVVFGPEDGGVKANMRVEEMVWASVAALQGMLGFLSNFTAHYGNFQYMAPEFLNLRLLVPEPYEVKTVGVCCGMGRIVDAARSLKTLVMPQGTEQVTICVKDDFLDWNNGTFLLREGDGATLVERTDVAPDMVCDVRTLVQLVSGYVTAEECISLSNVEIIGKFETFDLLFIKRAVFISDEF
jgi:predicted acetyltransferase